MRHVHNGVTELTWRRTGGGYGGILTGQRNYAISKVKSSIRSRAILP